MIGFGQSGFTIIAVVLDGHENALRQILTPIGACPAENGLIDFGTLDSLHYASITIIPIGTGWRLALEGNIDGTVSDFLATLCNSQGEGLDKVLCHCEGYSKGSHFKYLSSRDIGSGCFYVGCPGRTVSQIRDEANLRSKIEAHLGANPPAQTGQKEISSYVHSQPDLAFALKAYQRPWLIANGAKALIAGLILLAVLLVIGLFFAFKANAWITLGLLVGILLLIGISVALLNYLSSSDLPFANRNFKPDLADVLNREDFGPCNHMVSVTQIKPGFFRAMLTRLVLGAIGLLAVFVYNKGQLAGIPTIHFARWVIVERHTLVFFSNYSGSWESYLNDFIDKGHEGLTAVWSNSVGFPKAVGLWGEGATHEREFKVYARNSQSPTLVWYQAYPDLVTANVDNNTLLREGLIANLTEQEEARWIARF